MDKFEGHYQIWREKRTALLADQYDLEGKKVLELGCGYGHVGRMLADLGADVTSCDARPEYVDEAIRRGSKAVVYNIEDTWTLGSDWDLVVHWGVLYHTLNYGMALQCLNHSKATCLETEVCNSKDPNATFIHSENYGYDQAASDHKHGMRGSGGYVERLLNGPNRVVKRFDWECLNTEPHDYSWVEEPNGHWVVGRRRFWLVENLAT